MCGPKKTVDGLKKTARGPKRTADGLKKTVDGLKRPVNGAREDFVLGCGQIIPFIFFLGKEKGTGKNVTLSGNGAITGLFVYIAEVIPTHGIFIT